MPCIVGFNCESWKRRPPARFLGSIINTPKRVDGCLSLKDSAFDQQRRDNTGLEIDHKKCLNLNFRAKNFASTYLDFVDKNHILIGFSQQIIRRKITILKNLNFRAKKVSKCDFCNDFWTVCNAAAYQWQLLFCLEMTRAMKNIQNWWASGFTISASDNFSSLKL